MNPALDGLCQIQLGSCTSAATKYEATKTTRHRLQLTQNISTCLEELRQAMFEPLSALAILGFTTGTLGFIVSTISRLDEKTQEIRECESRLRSFRWQLEDAYMQLKVWHSIWVGNKAFPHETYVYFWGTEGLEGVQSSVNGITELSSQIRSLLYHPDNDEPGNRLPRSTITYWRLLIDKEVAQVRSRRDIDHQRASLVRRIGFAFFDNATLLEKIDRLKKHIEGLRDFTQYQFRLKQHSDPNEQVKPVELRRISDMKSFVDPISNFGNLIYLCCSPADNSEWAIELAPPEPGNTLDLWSELDADAIYIDFFVRDAAPDVQPNAIRLRLYAKDELTGRSGLSACITMRVREILLDHQKLEHHSEFDQYFSLLERPNRRSRPLRQMLAENIFSGSHRKAFEAERADLIYGLGHWTILLCETHWSYGLCTCKIRCICLADARIRHAFRPLVEAFPPSGCQHRCSIEGRLILLGVALAEVALAFPIDVIGQEDIRFRVGGANTTRIQLLGMLREKFGRNTITKAVSYCLDPDSPCFKKLLPLDHLDQYCQNIVIP